MISEPASFSHFQMNAPHDPLSASDRSTRPLGYLSGEREIEAERGGGGGQGDREKE